MPTTLSARDFLALANLVSEKGIRYFVETDANGQRDGLDLAGQLGLHAHVCDPRNAQTLAGLYPDGEGRLAVQRRADSGTEVKISLPFRVTGEDAYESTSV